MRLKAFLFILLFKNFSAQSQKTEIIDPSGFKHDYVVSSLNYIEDLKDTTRLKYIAVLRLYGVYDNELSMMQWLDLVKIKAKELGANAYYVTKYFETETNANLIVKLFFAGENVLKTNKTKRIINGAFVFNQTKFAKDSAYFYLNKKKTYFTPSRYFSIPIVMNEKNIITLKSSGLAPKKIFFKKDSKSRFFIIPKGPNSVYVFTPLVISVAGAIALKIKSNTFHELKYETGRFLMEIYK
ncbi:MAG: hypothetical protein H0W73_00730 [Bacteroidetes bacterium]|nr:hypothetical protein [Bacteroidota bacterium]